MWFAENISWRQFRRSLGAFSAIVCKDGSTVWAEDASGKTIASGESGVDDASVIQSAINQGGKVFITKETYIVDKILSVSGNTHLKFEKGAILKQKDGANLDTIIKIVGDDVIIENAEIDGNIANQTKNVVGMHSRGYSRIKIKGAKIYNCYDGIIIAGNTDTLTSSKNNLIIDCLVKSNTKRGILLSNLVHESIIKSCWVIDNAGSGIVMWGEKGNYPCYDDKILDCIVLNSGGEAYLSQELKES